MSRAEQVWLGNVVDLPAETGVTDCTVSLTWTEPCEVEVRNGARGAPDRELSLTG